MSDYGRATPGSRVFPLGIDAYRLTVTGDKSAGIIQNTGADWFGPLNPMAPVAPPEVAGRAFDYAPGANLELTPRAYEAIKFQDLRNLADNYDILRLCIETRKDQMENQKIAFKPKTLPNGEPACDPDDERIVLLYKFFERPDGTNYWGTWLRMLLEEMFVIDAATLFKRRTRAGQLAQLEVVDGSTIKRVIDDWGRTPVAPVPAYQQVLKGFPAVNYTTRDLLYAPRNVRINKFYGYSQVEQIIMSVNIALRRQLFQLNYYTDGNMPEALVGTPDTWTVEQVSRMQQSFDAMLAGNLAARRRLKFIPGGVAKNFVALKEPDLTGAQDEWLARVCCYCMSLPPTAFIKQNNRATAETAHDTALAEGLGPVQLWVVQGIVNRVIKDDFGWDDIEAAWDDDREVDPFVQMQVLTGYQKAGTLKINETRDQLGQEPIEGGDVPMTWTAAGYVRIDVNADAPSAGEAAQTTADNAKAMIDAKAKQPQLAPGEEAPSPNSDAPPPKDGGAAEKAARTFLARLGKAGRPSGSHVTQYGSSHKQRAALRAKSSPRSKGRSTTGNASAISEGILSDTEQGGGG